MVKEYEYGIGWARFAAMLSIVACHVLQAQNNSLCFILNVGVPVFLFISGYLFGRKRIGSVRTFYISRAIRILIPYYVMLFVILFVNTAQGVAFSTKELLSMLLCQQWYGFTVPKYGHLWYVSCVLFCYLITPVLEWFAEKTRTMGDGKFWVLICISVALLQLVQMLGGITQNVYSVVPYVIGYFWSFRQQPVTTKRRKALWIVLAGVCLAGFAVKYTLDTRGYSVPGILYEYYKVISGIVFVMFCINVADRKSGFAQKQLWLSDKYSYAIYLVHHIYILGALSVLGISEYLWVNIVFALLLTLVTAAVLHELSERIRKWILRKEC